MAASPFALISPVCVVAPTVTVPLVVICPSFRFVMLNVCPASSIPITAESVFGLSVTPPLPVTVPVSVSASPLRVTLPVFAFRFPAFTVSVLPLPPAVTLNDPPPVFDPDTDTPLVSTSQRS